MNPDVSATQSVQFQAALVDGQWQEDVVVEFTADGWISSVGQARSASDVHVSYDLVALPGMVNVHSHAFQRAFAGLSEYRTSEHDSFWTWRKLMYGFLLRLTPDDVYVIARQLYLEMLLAGYTWVAEFHYLHNDVEGQRYANIAELSHALIRAARDSGIGLCLLPVLYQRGGFDNAPLQGGQKRFGLSNPLFVDLFDQLNRVRHPDYSAGMALHSLRAVTTRSANEVIAEVLQRRPDCPIHIHVAEQMQEVEECVQLHGRRPVEFLFENHDVNSNWCLIHATHISQQEIELMARGRVVAGLCPTTEANLGDGLFSARKYLAAGGRISIGSDSHCSVDIREELRLLEYGQRLFTRQRAVLGTADQSVGRYLFDQSSAGGASAIGVKTGRIMPGYRADMILVDPHHPAIAEARGDRLLDRIVFCHAGNPVHGVMVGGKLLTPEVSGFHEKLEHSRSEFSGLCQRLL